MRIGLLRMLDLKHVTGRGHVRKFVLRMRNRKLRNILPSGALFTGSDSHMTVRGPVRPYQYTMLMTPSKKFYISIFGFLSFFVLQKPIMSLVKVFRQREWQGTLRIMDVVENT
jgi:hypothetical protein